MGKYGMLLYGFSGMFTLSNHIICLPEKVRQDAVGSDLGIFYLLL